jgi:hypothetical protein
MWFVKSEVSATSDSSNSANLFPPAIDDFPGFLDGLAPRFEIMYQVRVFLIHAHGKQLALQFFLDGEAFVIYLFQMSVFHWFVCSAGPLRCRVKE